MQKRYLLIVAVFLGILGGSLGHYLFESNDLQEELEAERDKNRKLSIKNSFHNELLIIDELLVQGNFSEAKKRYSEILTNTDSAFHDIIGSRI